VSRRNSSNSLADPPRPSLPLRSTRPALGKASRGGKEGGQEKGNDQLIFESSVLCRGHGALRRALN
jgi:hypothetical protein